MYRALIIDDEAPARKAIKALGQWEKHRIEVLYEAENGRQGLDMLREYRPELVFVDMRMPLISGVRFLQQACEQFPDSMIKYIVVSGYDDFEYAREAIKAGAMDYLLKPVKRTDLNQLLDQAVHQLDMEKQNRLSRSIYENLSAPMIREKIFSSIIDSYGRFHKINELHAIIGGVDEKTEFLVTVLQLKNGDAICDQRFHGDKHAFYVALANSLNELCKDPGKAFSFKSGKRDQEMILIQALPQGTPMDAVLSGLKKALLQLRAIFGLDSLAAPAEHPRALKNLDISYHEAKQKMDQINLLQPNQYVYAENTGELQARLSILGRKEQLLHALETGSLFAAVSVLERFFSDVLQAECFSIAHLEQTTAELKLLLEQVLRHFEYEMGGEKQYLLDFDSQQFQKRLEVHEYAEEVKRFFAEVFERTLQDAAPQEKINIEKIKAYIELHYFEEISISLFAEKFFASKEHLLRLFKQKYGCGIYEYTLRVRMEQAKALLRNSPIKIQEIAEQVGYKDDGYFRKAFKKYVGLSPNEFRSGLF